MDIVIISIIRPKRLGDLPKFTQLMSGRPEIQTFRVHTFNLHAIEPQVKLHQLGQRMKNRYYLTIFHRIGSISQMRKIYEQEYLNYNFNLF